MARNLRSRRQLRIDTNNMDDVSQLTSQTSMATLIIWNISKALEKNPHIDLRSSINEAQDRLARESHDVDEIVSKHPEERYLACALLAWQQLGHSDTDSLCRFVELKRKCEPFQGKNKYNEAKPASPRPRSFIGYKESSVDTNVFNNHSMAGPVVSLPVETKIVMRVDGPPKHQCLDKSKKEPNPNTMNKIDAACCLDTECIERLKSMDKATNELRQRAAKLARREAERVELLERAEAAWRDLELGYQRRLNLSQEKEDDIAKQTQKLIDERNAYKNACNPLAQQLKQLSESAEKEREKLNKIEKEVCDRACVRMRVSENCARSDALLVDQQCKVSQLDRDLMFKEEQARRRQMSIENELESTSVLTHEAERAMRGELSALREQIEQVSKQLLQEDAENGRIKDELNNLREEKMEMVEDLEGCKVTCDGRMQKKVDELNSKRGRLTELKEKVTECRCKFPVDESVEVKRTASLAALCHCTPEDKILDSCSCTSLRGRLLSNLLADLFGGLQAELGGSGTQMPCQLLKCLEDRHNWDRASVVKTNLRNFFSQLLIGELDIAIATSIEKYHAKWVGASCADELRMLPEPGQDTNEGWQERAIEKKAQKLATKLAEQLFKERADEVAKQAKDLVIAGPPPCECKLPSDQNKAVFSCVVKQPMITSNMRYNNKIKTTGTVDNVCYPANNTNNAKTNNLGSNNKGHTGNNGKTNRNNNVENASKIIEDNNISCIDSPNMSINDTVSPAYLRRTIQDVTQLRVQIEDLKKDAIKKEDLKLMEKKITKIVQRATGPDYVDSILLKDSYFALDKKRKENKVNNLVNQDSFPKSSNQGKSNISKKKILDFNTNLKKGTRNYINQSGSLAMDKQSGKLYKRPGQSFAVNLCLCGSQRDSKNMSQKKKSLQNTLQDDESKMFWIQKSSPYELSPTSNMKPIKSIEPTSLKVKNNFECSKTSTQPSCGNQGVCFHKVPSNTSIDKLLETLAKWKCDLTEKEKTEKFPQKDDAIKLKKKNTVVIDTDNISYGLIKTQKNENITNSKTNNFDNENNILCQFRDEKAEEKIVHSIEFERIMPSATESEYLGAVNLDKSNEIFCKNSLNHKKEELECTQNTALYSFSHKDVILNGIRQEKSHEISKNIEPPIFIPSNMSKTKEPFKYTNDPHEYENHITEVKNNSCYIDVGNVELNNTISSEKNRVKTSDRFSYDGDYIIEFLGVTLANLNKTKDDVSGENDIKPIQRFKTSAYQCQIDKNENVRHQMHDGDCHNIKNIGIDIQSFKDNTSKYSQEECVCCVNSNIEESKELEVNAFSLLEDHLKQKLEEIKMSSGKRSCILPDQEQRLFTTILQKIKQVILNSTNNVTCKCAGEEKSQGSWNRAYSLLQEYLRIKINRVQCLCVPKGSKSTILPSILEEVNNLIEGDFQRLKEINEGRDEKILKEKNYPEHNYFEIPEKDTCSDKSSINQLFFLNNIEDTSIKKASKEISNMSFALTQNISSQVPQNLGMETKSCGSFVKRIECTQTLPDIKHHVRERKTRFESDSSRSTSKKDIELHETSNIIANVCTETEQANELIISRENEDPSHDKNSENGIDMIPATNKTESTTKLESVMRLPYIGYTLDCSCDTKLGACVCTKSMVEANSDKICDIWKTLTSNKMQPQNVSYIMDNVSNKCVTQNMTVAEVTRDVLLNDILNSKTVYNPEQNSCETEATIDEEIILKKSVDFCNKSHIGTNTSKLEPKERLHSEDVMNWYECSSYLQRKSLESNITNSNCSSEDFPFNINGYNQSRSETLIDNCNKKPDSFKDCDCSMVPICHVKMLVENIENKLINSKCTCDSMTSKVCPIHSKKRRKL